MPEKNYANNNNYTNKNIHSDTKHDDLIISSSRRKVNSEEEIDPDEIIKEKEDSERTLLQNKFYYFFEEPRSILAKSFLILSVSCMALTVVVICIESYATIPDFDDIWFPIDLVVASVFTVDYLGRFYASLHKFKFIYRPLNLIDFFSILPFYLQFIHIPGQADLFLRVLRIVRLLRILRIIHITRYSIGLSVDILYFSFHHGEFLDPATLKWYRYNGTGMEISPFQSIIDALWWSITTLTTTGYGDAVPVTAPGKFVAGVTMICGIMVIALLTSIIGSNFVSEWALHKQIQHQLRLRKKTAAAQNEYQVSKTKRIRILRSQNEIMLETISEIQDKLSDLNPPLYYKKYKNIRAKYIEATKRISELEAKLEKCSQTIRDFESPDDDQIHPIENNNNNDTAGDGFDSNVFGHNDLINSNDSSITYHGARSFNWKKIMPSLKMKFTKSLPNSTLSSNNGNILADKQLVGSPTDLRPNYNPVEN
ncbi:1885_t:CDS:2 [Entrophospora sp. SA101]|nr:1885_t:CDS:2 [Entrophospora sp. SA101]